MVRIIMTDGDGDMGTVRTMRIEQLDRVLYTTPATEIDVIMYYSTSAREKG